ncbi:MAG: efflux RND transporter periplasmic adaptor subunit [Ignavibacteriae bacterium]|nr:efflux RND transporter periplasmic adaptor subunit [Ignavibacteriota bacterium]
MKKIYRYLILAIVILGTAGYFWIRNSNNKDITYRTETISRGDIVVQVRATGTIKPVQTVQVGSQVSGIIAKINVDFNSEVKKGQIIAVIDSTFLYASVKEAQANLERNQAQINEAERNLKRTKDLFSKDLVSQADLDAATTGYETSLAQLKQSEAALERARVNLRYAIIRAPIDGVVISRDVDVGQTVAASLQAPKLFEIANDLKHMQVEASVDEADIGQIKETQEATFTVDAHPEEEFHGTVTQVRLAPVTVQNVVTYTVVIEVNNPDLKLRPGMTATVSILIDKRDNVLRIPTLALRFQPPAEAMEKFKEQTAEAGEKPEEHDSVRIGEKEKGRSTERWQRASDGERERWRERMMRGTGQVGGEMMTRRSGDKSQMTRIWILDNGKRLKSVTVSTGLNDSRYVEVIGGDVKEGDEIVLGTIGAEMAAGSTQQTNPFQPRMPGGGGRRGF